LILPLLEALAKGFFLNRQEFCYCIWFNVLHVCKMCPMWPIFWVGNSQRSLGVRFREYDVWMMKGMLFSVRNCCTTSNVWLSALSWYRNHCPCHLSCRFLRTALHNLCKTCM
jgi:hypothetical protein